MFFCRSMENFVQAYRDMSPARIALANNFKRSFTQMAVVRLPSHCFMTVVYDVCIQVEVTVKYSTRVILDAETAD